MPDMVLHIKPRRTLRTLGDFVKAAPPGSIALDGYVAGPPCSTPDKQHVSFNHHEGVNRSATRATCAQVYVAIKTGLFRALTMPDRSIHVFVNDCDQDVCLAWWLLCSHERIEGQRSEPLINRLVFAQDMLDATGGAYPFSVDSMLMREISWIFHPYASQRQALPSMDADGMRAIVDAVGSRISSYAMGLGKEQEPAADLEIVRDFGAWSMVKEKGADARTALFEKGVVAFVSVREDGDRWHYSIGRSSDYVPFPVAEILRSLNDLECFALGETGALDGWGGSDLIGGSPRQGSRLRPDDVASVVNRAVATLAAERLST